MTFMDGVGKPVVIQLSRRGNGIDVFAEDELEDRVKHITVLKALMVGCLTIMRGKDSAAEAIASAEMVLRDGGYTVEVRR
jgi:hypothetical protein